MHDTGGASGCGVLRGEDVDLAVEVLGEAFYVVGVGLAVFTDEEFTKVVFFIQVEESSAGLAKISAEIAA